jgi:hypothetical protein
MIAPAGFAAPIKKGGARVAALARESGRLVLPEAEIDDRCDGN